MGARTDFRCAGVRPALAGLAGLALVGCAGGEVTSPAADESDSGPTVSRDVMVVTVRVPEEDSATAASLGWPGRRVPGARVKLLPERISVGLALEDSIVQEAGDDGTAVFEDLLPGITYRVSVVRQLSEEEQAAVEADRPTLRAFGGGTKRIPGDSTVVPVIPNRSGGLLISEVAAAQPLPGEPGSGYNFNGYIALYNNSAETVFLDGVIIAESFPQISESRVFPCSEGRRFLADPDGLWSLFFQAFPGAGSEHPLEPGEFVVVAGDAIDHSQVAPVFLDLRDADFEFTGPGDVDNPNVPNMVDVGLAPFFLGHGFNQHAFAPHQIEMFVSDPVSVDALPRARPEAGSDAIYVRFPAEGIRDATFTVFALPGGSRLCPERANDRFDRLAKAWAQMTPGGVFVHNRRIAGPGPDGRTLLLDTNTSEVDFFWTERTPGRFPPP